MLMERRLTTDAVWWMWREDALSVVGARADLVVARAKHVVVVKMITRNTRAVRTSPQTEVAASVPGAAPQREGGNLVEDATAASILEERAGLVATAAASEVEIGVTLAEVVLAAALTITVNETRVVTAGSATTAVVETVVETVEVAVVETVVETVSVTTVVAEAIVTVVGTVEETVAETVEVTVVETVVETAEAVTVIEAMAGSGSESVTESNQNVVTPG